MAREEDQRRCSKSSNVVKVRQVIETYSWDFTITSSVVRSFVRSTLALGQSVVVVFNTVVCKSVLTFLQIGPHFFPPSNSHFANRSSLCLQIGPHFFSNTSSLFFKYVPTSVVPYLTVSVSFYQTSLTTTVARVSSCDIVRIVVISFFFVRDLSVCIDTIMYIIEHFLT